MPAFDFFKELKRRRVLRAVGLYIVAGWVVIQAATTILPVFGFPAWVSRVLIVGVAAGVPIVFVTSWLYDITSAGVQRTARSVPRSAQVALVIVSVMLTVGAVLVGAVELTHMLAAPPPLHPGAVQHMTNTTGLELDPSLSPEGRRVAFAAGTPGHMRIFVREVAGGRAIPLAESLTVNQRAPQWSPDGAYIMFQGGGREMPIGKDAADSTYEGSILVVPALGGIPRRMTPTSTSALYPAWSPDGKRIAYVEVSGIQGLAIRIMPSDRSTPGELVATERDTYSLSWSPDGAMLALVKSNPRAVFGTAHLGNDAPTSVWTITLADRRIHRITAGTTLDLSPVWMPDSRSLLFVSSRDGARDVYRVRITRKGEADGDVERITSGLNAHGISLSRDGRTIAYSAFTSYSHIWSVPIPATGEANMREATQITTGNETVEGFALSPDGKWLAYDSNRSGNGDIWMISAAGGPPQQLTTAPEGEYVQDFSPDGRAIAYHVLQEGVRHIYVMNSDGTRPQQVTSGVRNDANPDFTADGNTLIFDAWGDTPLGLFSVSRAHRDAPWSAPRNITRSGTDASCSPDGRWTAYMADGALHIVTPNGSADRTIVAAQDLAQTPEPVFAYWSRDGRTLYYKAYDNEYRSSIWSVSVDGGEPRRLIHFEDQSRPSQRREFATDGVRLYFTVAEPESDIWLMQLTSK